MKKILIVEDDRTLREGLRRSLISDDMTADCAATIAEAYEKFNSGGYDIVLLDCNLPDGSGVDFCAGIRLQSSVPVIFLTVLDSELDEVSAFKAGGTDYVKKPFSLMVLRERINAALSRSDAGMSGSAFCDGRYRFDFYALSFTVYGNEVALSPAEQKLLRILTNNRRQIVPRDRLIELLWSCQSDYIDENALSVVVRRIRAKLGAECIKTMYGLGYMWTGDVK